MSWAWLDRLVEIEESVADLSAFPELRAYRWAPTSQVQAPFIFNRLAPSRTEFDVCNVRDLLVVEVVTCVRHTENRQDQSELEDYLDALREPLDAELYGTDGQRLGLRQARRIGIVPVQERFNDIIFPGIAYRLELRVDHQVR